MKNEGVSGASKWLNDDVIFVVLFSLFFTEIKPDILLMPGLMRD